MKCFKVFLTFIFVFSFVVRANIAHGQPETPIPIDLNDYEKDPYKYIGIVLYYDNHNKVSGKATATLIGKQYILTAKHVLEAARERKEQGKGVTIFMLPNGVQSELFTDTDGKYYVRNRKMKLKGISFSKTPIQHSPLAGQDLGIAKLKVPIGDDGYAEWREFTDQDFGEKVDAAGYDSTPEYKRQDYPFPFNLDYPLLERSGKCQKSQHAQNLIRNGSFIGIVLSGVLFFGPTWKIIRCFSVLTGGLSTLVCISADLVKPLDSAGWATDEFSITGGGSGGPIWRYDNGKPTVIGIMTGRGMCRDRSRFGWFGTCIKDEHYDLIKEELGK